MSHQPAMLPAAHLTIGLDLGDATSRVYAVDADAQCVGERTIPTTPAGLQRYFGAQPRSRVVLEAGTHSPWVARSLATLGHQVIVANPNALRGPRRRKRNDRIDAEYLARQGRADPRLLQPITHRSESGQHHLEVLRARDHVVQLRTKLINHVRGAVKSVGQRLPRCSAEAFTKRAVGAIPSGLEVAVQPLLELIADLTARIRRYDQQVTRLTRQYPDTERLQRPVGVGALTALAYVLLVEDPSRFRNSRAAGAYFGLVPKLDESSTSRPQLRITKAGDEFGRRLLVNAAQYILGPFGPPSDLRRHGEQIAHRGGKNAKKRAVIAVARKLAVLLHRLWLSDRPYEPDYTLTHHAA